MSVDWCHKVLIEKLFKENLWLFCHYKPKLFHVLIYRMSHPSILKLIIMRGSIVITGARKRGYPWRFLNIYVLVSCRALIFNNSIIWWNLSPIQYSNRYVFVEYFVNSLSSLSCCSEFFVCIALLDTFHILVSLLVSISWFCVH